MSLNCTKTISMQILAVDKLGSSYAKARCL